MGEAFELDQWEAVSCSQQMVATAVGNGLNPNYVSKVEKALQTAFCVNRFHGFLLQLF